MAREASALSHALHYLSHSRAVKLSTSMAGCEFPTAEAPHGLGHFLEFRFF